MGKGHRLTFLLVCLVGCCYADDATSDSNKPASTVTWIDKLKKNLLANYDRNARPTQHYNVTNLDLKMTIRHVDIDEENSIFSVYGWVKMSWIDLRLIWTPSDYGGTQSIVIPSYYLWDPELTMHSVTLESSGSSFIGSSNVQIGYDGVNNVIERLNFKSFCGMNFRSWPFDTHHCSIVLGKMEAHKDDAVQIHTLPAEWERINQGNTMWHIVSASVEAYQNPIEVTYEKFIGVQYGIVVQRKVQIFQSTVIAPAIVLILMSLTTFWLPPNASEKVLLNCINAGIVCAFLLYFTVHLPLLATRTPLVVLFFSNSLYLTAFSLVLSVMVVNMVKSKHRRPIHPYIKGFMLLPGVGVFAWTGNNVKIGMPDDEDWVGEMAGESCSSVDEASQAQHEIQRDWIQLAVILDRICFVVYVFIYSVMAEWTDDKLKWNPDDYGKLENFRINPDSVWKPDVVLYNNARGSDNLHYGQTNAIVYYNGKILWVPPTDYHSFCDLNLRHWPFDYQTCILKLGSWTYDGYQLNLTYSEDPEIDIGVPNNEWSIRNVSTDRNTVFYKCCTEPYIDIQYNITLQRHSSTHKAIVVSPAFVIMLLALSVFWLPPQCGEKIVLNGIIVLIVTVFLIYFAQHLPAMSGTTPLIVTFYSTTFYLVAVSTMLSVIVLRLTRSRQCYSVPRFLKGQLDGCLGSVLGVSSSGNLPSEEDKEAAGGEVPVNTKQNDWYRLAALMDRLAFVVYLIIFVISVICFSL